MCEICKRWRERIQAAKDAGDEKKVELMRKLWSYHRDDKRYHGVRHV